MKNNKTPRLAETAYGCHFSSASGPRTEPTKKPAAVSHPGLMLSFGEYAFLEDPRYASQAFCGLGWPHAEERCLKRVHARLRRAMAPRLEAWGRLILRDGRFAASSG